MKGVLGRRGSKSASSVSAATRLDAPPMRLTSAGATTSEPQVPEEATSAIKLATIKIYTHSVAPSYLRPWTRCDGVSCTGSGFAIEGRRLLTNSHVIHNGRLLQVQRHDRPGKWVARLLCEGVQCDLALLAVDGDDFWEGLPLCAITDELPPLECVVTAVGYPLGGENLSVTRGVVSRIDLLDYTFIENSAGERLLVLQIDAAINPGNSGGPVVDRSGRVVGVAFAGLDEADNIGYVIPMPVIRLFLRSYEARGTFGQLPRLGLQCQLTENKAVRRMLGLQPDGRQGVLVVGVAPLMPVAQLVRVGDVLMELDGHALAEDGSVEAMHGLRLPWDFLVTRRGVGERCSLSLLRDGERVSGEVELRPEPRLVPYHDQVDARPSYVIVGGLVFVALSLPAFEEGLFDELEDPLSAGLVLAKLGAPRAVEDEQVIVLAKVLESELTIGYGGCVGKQLQTLNGQKPLNLKQLAAMVVAKGEGAYLKFAFDKFTAVLERARSKQQESDLLASHEIASWCSRDVDLRADTALARFVGTCFSPGPAQDDF